MEYVSTPIWEKSHLIGAVVTFRDVSKRRQAELEVTRTLERLNKALRGTVDALSLAAESRDPYTAGHQRRVAQLACAIARKKGLSEDAVEGIRVAGLLHDIGKIYVPAEFLTKPSRLTDIERQVLSTHPQVGYDILENIDFSWPIAEIVLQHHEKLDGSGYPRRLKGKEILLEARILSVADVVEAMGSHRPYRASLGIERALDEISQHKGIFYDTEVVDICAELFAHGSFEFDPSALESTPLHHL